tara:strand:+ start:12512 stop:13993 length:1482 start_codon:yes stop_codon:yes gene_type:complete
LEKRFPNSKVINADINDVDFTKLEPVDILIGGFPCQSFSYAGNRKGMSEEDERGILWYQFERAISILKPKWVVAENVRGLLTAKDNEGNKGGAFGRVVSFLSDRGYSVEWQIVSAASVNASHLRERIFIVGNSEHFRSLETKDGGSVGERTLPWGQIKKEQEEKYRQLERESQAMVNSESKSSIETDKQTSSLSESREARVDIGDGHGGEESEIDWEKITQQVGLPSNGFSPGLAGRLGLPNYWTYNRDLMWRTPTTMDSKSGEDALKYATKLLQGKTHRASGQPVQITLADQIAIDQIHKNPDLFEKYKDHEIYKRPNLPPQKTFVKYLKDNVTRSTLYDALDVKKTTIDHWFRNDKYFSYPSMEDWEKLKPYLKVIKYDEEMTTIESFEWQKQKWQTPLVTSSRPSTKRIAEGINPKGNLAENPDVYKDEYIIEPWETVPRTIEDEEKRVDKIKALGNAVVPACAEFIGICISNAIKFKTIVFDADMLEDW